VADQPVTERIAFLAEGQVPDSARDQTVALVGGGAGTILRNVELVSDVEAAEGAFIAPPAAVAGACHVLRSRQSVSEMELKSPRQPLPRLQQESVIPAQAQRTGHVNLAQIRVGPRQIHTLRNSGGRASDPGSIGNAKGGTVGKLVGAREVRWGKIGIVGERQTLSFSVDIAGREDDATRQ